MPAETVPAVGAPATFDWQLPRSPVKLYAKFPEVFVSGGLMLATPCSWHAPPLGPAAPASDPPRVAMPSAAPAMRTIRERWTLMVRSSFGGGWVRFGRRMLGRHRRPFNSAFPGNRLVEKGRVGRQ